MRALDRYNLALALLLALLLWLNQRPAQEPPPILDIEASQVRTIRVMQEHRLRLSLAREHAGWRLAYPDMGPASTRRVDGLLSLLQARSYWVSEAPPASLHIYGLQSPALSVHIDQHRLDFGDASQAAGQRYVLLNDKVHLIDENYYRIAGLPASHFRKQP